MKILLTVLLLLSGIQVASGEWVQSEGLEGGSILSLCVLDSTFYAATRGGGIYSSSDNGNSWVAVDFDLPYSNFTKLFASDSTLFAVINNDEMVYRSDNKGMSWSTVETEFTNMITSIDVCDSLLIARTSGGVFRSIDNGYSWTEITSRIYIDSMPQYFYNPFFVKDHAVFTVVRDSLYTSIDEGLISWTAIGPAPARSVLSFTVIDNDIIAVTYGLLRSSDNGASWTEVDIGMENTAFEALAIKDSIILVGTTRYGVCRSSDNGESWTAVNSGIKNTSVYSLAVLGNTVIAGTQTGFYTSDNKGINWHASQVEGGNATSFTGDCLLPEENKLFAVRRTGTGDDVVLSEDRGVTWKPVISWLPDTTIHTLTIDGNTLLAGTSEGIFMSDDDGSTWSATTSTLKYVRSLVVSGDSIIVGSDVGGVLISSDYGVTWSDHKRIDPREWDFPVHMIKVQNTLFACGGYGIYYSTTNGTNWTMCIGSTPVVPGFNCLFPSGNNLFAGSSRGVSMSSDNGRNWTDVNANLKNTVVYSFAADDSTMYIGTRSGVWRRPLSDFTLSVKNEEFRTTSQNDFKIVFPDQSKTNTTISFTLQHPEHVLITVYNLSGSFIQSITNRYFTFGSHTIVWDTRSLSAGFYLVKMKTPTNCSTKMISHIR